ncbi:MAG: secretin N-terminal domain-containing protein [Planctomycetota bacterium]
MLRLIPALALMIALISPALTGEAPAPIQKGNKENGIAINLSGTTLEALLEYVGKVEGKPVVLPPNFPKESEVSLITPEGTSLPADQLNNLIGKLLRHRGFALVIDEALIHVLPLTETVSSTTKIQAGKVKPTTQGLEIEAITKIISLKYAQAGSVAKELAQLKSKGGNITVSTSTNKLIITDYADNIERLIQVIKELDVEPDKPVMFMHQLKHTRVEEIKRYVDEYNKSYIKPRGANTGRVQPILTVDEEKNAVVCMGNPSDVANMKQLINALDVPMRFASSHYVYKLHNTSAKDVAKLLQSILSKKTNKKGGWPTPVITADEAKNMLVISAVPEAFNEVQKLLS